MIYLDNAATTYPKPEKVYEAMNTAFRENSFNAGRGSYRKAKEANRIIDDLRREIAKLAHAPSPDRVILTPSATHAMNQILQGISLASGDVIYASPYEHNAVMRVLQSLTDKGMIIRILAHKENKELDLEQITAQFAMEAPSLVCVTQVSNVTGYILPIEPICTLAKQYEATTVIDGAQGFGLVSFSMDNSIYDYYVFAGHKTLYGPFGLGGFIKGTDANLNPILYGGTGSDSLNTSMPATGTSRYEVGSSNLPAVAGLLEAVKCMPPQEEVYDHERQLILRLRNQLTKIAGVTLFPNEVTDDYVGIVSFGIDGFKADEIGMILDEDYDIAVRTGYHCAPLVHEMIGSIEYGGTVRVSFGQFNTDSDVDEIVRAIRELVE